MDHHGPPQSTRGRMISSPSAQASSGGFITRTNKTEQLQNAILPLPTDVVTQIKSSTAIICLSGVIVELLKNSLDAGATKVEITVDFARGGCIVEDNGLGISPTEFREEGGLGKMYCTSKYNSEDVVYGRNGTFLASLAAMSLLTVTSHHYQHCSHNTITLHHCKTIVRHLPAPSQQEISFREHGTRVTVRDLFGNMPVRVKQRAVALEGRAEHERLWEGLKIAITGLLLGWTNSALIKLQNSDKSRMLTMNGQRFNTPIFTNCKGKLPEKSSSLELRYLLNILTQASYISPEDWSSWVPVSASTASISIKGAISLNPAPNKRVQFLALGIRPISTDSGNNELYDEINRIFKYSSFGSVEDTSDVDEIEKERRKLDRRFKSDGFTNRQIRGGRKGVDRWPMDAILESEGKLQSVVEVLSAMVTQWLSVHHFRPHKRRAKLDQSDLNNPPTSFNSAHEQSFTPARDLRSHFVPNSELGSEVPLTPKTTRTTDATSRKRKRRTSTAPGSTAHSKRQTITHFQKQHFADWSRIKSGKVEFYDKLWSTKSTPTSTQGVEDPFEPIQSGSVPNGSNNMAKDDSFEPSIFDLHPIMPGSLKSSALSRASSFPALSSANVNDDVEDQPLESNMEQPSEYFQDETMTWTNPTTNEHFLVNARTGCVIPRLPFRPKSDTTIPTGKTSTLSDFTKSMRMRPRGQPAATDDKGTPWLQNLLKDWDNPVFKQSEKSIPQVSLEAFGTDIAEIGRVGHHQCSHVDINTAFKEVSISKSNKLSKNALRNAKVIAQVDGKFILVKLAETAGPVTPKQLLVLIDQHAADERIRIEALFSDLCTPSRSTNPSEVYQSSLGYKSRVNYVILVKPLYFLVSAQESDLFCSYAEHFANWGILYDVDPPIKRALSGNPTTPGTKQHTLTIATLPPSIAERCKADPKLVTSLLRSEVWTLAESVTRSSQEPPKPAPDEDEDEEHHWLRQIGSCPRGLIDMLNSRACRSAIMFNDTLDLEQCEELVTTLAKCAFPFQCAHGRPSMVPLLELGAGEEKEVGDVGLGFGLGPDEGPRVIRDGKGKNSSFRTAYKIWREK
ncbi:hypothetical protein AOQ84DRAFT_338228 [Glonium stellatum]|uniref:MutL C-terminal dimerisation domain-containing protein n=1 Tax=Glonium stellatum TaxID=574774 RepID=A0A8E2F421_9PEZI|nr:hypothetical protein AOQ84DRAFT_338228 [Glonium stellatum]